MNRLDRRRRERARWPQTRAGYFVNNRGTRAHRRSERVVKRAFFPLAPRRVRA